MKNSPQNPLLLLILLVRILVMYHSHYLKLSEEENISFGSSTTIAYCEPSLSPGFIGPNFLLFFNDTLHSFAQAESGCSESCGPRRRYSGSPCPSPVTLVTPDPVAWPLLYLFFFAHLWNENLYTGSWTTSKAWCGADRMMALEIL